MTQSPWTGGRLNDKQDYHQDEPNQPGRIIVATSVNGIQLRAPRWLYDKRIPTGAITLLAGREGIGKSTIAYDLAAKITHGKLPGRYLDQPAAVGVVATEDDWHAVIGPRLMAAGADLTKIYRIDVVEDDKLDIISMPRDLDRLASSCLLHGIVLLLLDPIMSLIASQLDTHKDRDVRQALDPLARFATTTGVAVLALIHVNKSSTSDPLNSIMASRAFSAVARSVLYCVTDPEDETEQAYLFGHPKSNLGPKQPTIGYRLIEHKVPLDEPDPEPWGESVITTSRVEWGEADGRTIRDAMEHSKTDRVQGELATSIEEWVRGEGRTVSANELVERYSHINRSTLDKNLSRMVNRGKLSRPVFGHYALANHADTKVGTDSDTLSGDVLSVRSDRSARLQDQSVTSDTSDALTPRQNGVRNPPTTVLVDWSAALYDRER